MKVLIKTMFITLVSSLVLAQAIPNRAYAAQASAKESKVSQHQLELVAESEHQWTGIGVTSQGEIFVNFPRWSEDIPMSVARLVEGVATPFPDASWNNWKEGEVVSATKFVAVQSVVVDSKDNLWVLDTGNPRFQGVEDGGARLFSFTTSGELHRSISFPDHIAPKDSYLNDVRFDHKHGFAYLTDSGLGALIAVNLKTGEMKRWLSSHASTKSEDIDVVIDGSPWRMDGVDKPQVHADGIAYDQNSDTVFFQALTATTLYGVPAAHLRNFSMPDNELANHLRLVANVGPSDGLLMDSAGRVLLTSLEKSAIRAVPKEGGAIEVIASDSRLAWPDSLSMGPGGYLYLTTAQIHKGPNPKDPYRIFRVRL